MANFHSGGVSVLTIDQAGMIADYFTDLANNTVGVLDVATDEFGQFVGVGQAPYGLSFLNPQTEERRTELLEE